MLLIICIKYEMNPFWTVDATGQTYNFGNDTIFVVYETLNISFIANMKYKKVAPILWRHDMMT